MRQRSSVWKAIKSKFMTMFYDAAEPVQRRCFNWILLISGVTCILGATTDLLTQYEIRTVVFTYISAGITFFFLYMVQRSKNILTWQIIGFVYFLFIFFPTNYITSYGYNGITFLFMIMMISAIALSLEGKLRIFMFVLSLALSVGLIWLQVISPEIFTERPSDPVQVGLNFTFAMLTVLVTTFWLIYIVMQSYGGERKRAEAERSRAEEAARVKADFLATVSHEIRTPMNAILGITEILSYTKLDASQKKYLADMQNSATSLLSIINDILDFSKIEAGKFELVPTHFSLMRFLDNICSFAMFEAEKKKLRFSSKVDVGLPEVICADENRVRQILINILGNAVKYTREGEIQFSASLLPNKTILFAVNDTGIGIKPQDMEKIFGAFQQIDMRRNRNVQGTGLGLSISKILSELMGGELWAESEYGKGSTFYIRIPYAEGNPERIEAEKIVQPRRSYRGRVLVVDDNMINLSVAEGILSQFEIMAELALSGQEAIDKLKDQPYDLVFMDHMMPEMDGIETTKRIRQMGGPMAEIPIVALTANAIVGVSEQFLEAGMNDFLSKPIEVPKLNTILHKYLEERQ